AIEERVSYLRITLAAPPDEGWIPCADLVEDGRNLAGSIEATQAGRKAPDLQVTASLWFQSYAFRVAIPVVAPFALDLPGLSADPSTTAIRVARDRPAAVAVTDPAVIERSAPRAAHDLFGSHLEPLVDAITREVTVGRRLLWGNATASVATVLRALEGAPGADRQRVRTRAGELLEAAAEWTGGLGRFDLVTEGDREGWFWTRTNCCLYERCEGAARCDDCSLIPAAELEAGRRASLLASESEVAS
ncbi:MAG TPA: IucA/IucC family C-terminal-domain containing protein, partial [Acidimicrobiales bacterium]|nr:IucA/IucC family C-terminal-domain containing protein [Acidimicrobiales bacterium]